MARGVRQEAAHHAVTVNESLFCELFQGRDDAYGIAEGGRDMRPAPPWGQRVIQHLATPGEACGVYPLTERGVMWGCTDLDYTDDPTEAWMLALGLQHVGLNGWVERSRSKGFHVWTFSNAWVDGLLMRRALLAVHQRLTIEAREVNPKQTEWKPERLGNYVRLPYPAGWEATDRQVMIEPSGDTIPLDVFTVEAQRQRSSPDAYRLAATLWQPPPPKKHVTATASGGAAADIAGHLSRTAYLCWRYGPREGHDRSATLARLAHLCRADRIPDRDALTLLVDLDDRLGKFVDRPNRIEILNRLIDRAYT